MATPAPRPLRVGLLPCPDGLDPAGRWCDMAAREVAGAALDLLITSEMPFGAWLAASDCYDPEAAAANVALHEQGLPWLHSLAVLAIATSRAVVQADRLANEALVVTGDAVRPLHHKRHLPQEPGYFEATWFVRGAVAPKAVPIGNAMIGALLCTEVMLPEDARRLGQQGADLLAIPRATGPAVMWDSAVAMAAVSAGAFAISVNRGGDDFQGGLIACDPDGARLTPDRVSEALWVLDLDLAAATASKATYPRYVFPPTTPREATS